MCCSVKSLGCWLFECAVQWCLLCAVWIVHSMMPLGCWLFECAVQWCLLCAVWMCCSAMSLGCCLNVLFSDVTWVLFECYSQCHWGAECLNVLFSGHLGAVWMLQSMSLGCWMFECAVQWCHLGADCLKVMLNDVTNGSDNHISLSVMTVRVTPRFFLQTTSQISSLMCVCVWTLKTFLEFTDDYWICLEGYVNENNLWDLNFSQWWCWRFKPSVL
jgi:hypothetical protein